MDRGTLVRKYKVNLVINLVLGLALLISGIIVEASDIQILDNNRILTALSFIPLAIAIAYLIRINQVRKSPEKAAEETDERIIATKDRADAISMRIIRYISWLGFLAYSFGKSTEVFESFTWWLIAGIALAATLLPVFFMGDVNKKHKQENE